jgi:predicted RNA binding protein YcfA (HicA-like mRNA interferase family)
MGITMNDQITFAAFEQFLHGLGFASGTVPGSHAWYEHPASDTVIMARLHKPSDHVPRYTFLSARQELIEKGLATAEAFDELTRAPAS